MNDVDIKLILSEPTKRTYEISVIGSRLRLMEEKWVKAARSQASIPGFRQGQVPDPVLIAQAGEWIREQASHELFDEITEEIIKNNNLPIVFNPVIGKVDYKFGLSLKFESVFEVEPPVSIKNYLGLELEQYDLRPIKDDDVDRELKAYLTHEEPLYLVPLNGSPAIPGETFALIHARCLGPDGPVFEWRQELVALDEEALPSGLSEALGSLKLGERKNWKVPLDEDCPVKSWEGKSLEFEVELLDLKKVEQPAAGANSFLEKYKDHLPKWKDEIHAALHQRRDTKIRGLLKDQITGELLRENPLDVPRAEVAMQTQRLIDRARAIFSMSGKELAHDHEKELRVKYAIEATNEIRLGYLLREIAKRESIKVGDEDYEKALASAADEKDREAMKKNKETVLYDLLLDKVFDFLIAKAKIKMIEV
ncbi:MAG: hypothetical protein HY547_06390 [Elusimicrobia bacterium]|nr:hypothetical protein [Elusimicrobiota bacterium]